MCHFNSFNVVYIYFRHTRECLFSMLNLWTKMLTVKSFWKAATTWMTSRAKDFVPTVKLKMLVLLIVLFIIYKRTKMPIVFRAGILVFQRHFSSVWSGKIKGWVSFYVNLKVHLADVSTKFCLVKRSYNSVENGPWEGWTLKSKSTSLFIVLMPIIKSIVRSVYSIGLLV